VANEMPRNIVSYLLCTGAGIVFHVHVDLPLSITDLDLILNGEEYTLEYTLQRSPDPLAGLKGSLLLRKGRRGGTEGAAASSPIGS